MLHTLKTFCTNLLMQLLFRPFGILSTRSIQNWLRYCISYSSLRLSLISFTKKLVFTLQIVIFFLIVVSRTLDRLRGGGGGSRAAEAFLLFNTFIYFQHLRGASKIKLKKVNKKRTVTVRRVITSVGQRYSKMYRLKRYRYTTFEKKIG
jgi:hypothetical protein